MAGTIKGISVKISGNTVDLQNSLKDISKTSKSLQSELNLVNKQLKFDPTNSVLLAQKQEILEEKIANTKAALEKLDSVKSQVEEQAKSGDLGVEKYRAYQREVETTKNILKNLEKQLDDAKAAQNSFESNVKNVNLSSGTQEVKGLKDEVDNLNDKAKNVNLSNLKNEIDDVKSSASDLKDTLKDTAAGIGAGLGVAGGAVVAAVKSYDSVESAMNTIRASTGMSESSAENLRSTLESIYNAGFGENLEDVASKMASVVQITNETNPEKIKKYVQSLYSLEDTFDMDFNETLRGVQGLIINMGLSAETAFDLIASGAQNGLNYSGELGDNIAEYSQLWDQAGFSATEMFAILDNGTESGAYNLDKINDFVKEFTISLADGRIEENLSSFSDETADLFKKWQDGKATAADVFYSVINDLATAENQQKALTTASDTWSALGEDNALQVITSLNKVNKKFDDVKGTMDEVNDVKYDDVQSRLKTLGRKAQTEIINPLIEDFFPEIEDGIDWVSDNLDDIIPIVKGIGREIAIVWGAKKANEIVTGVINLVNAYKTLKMATDTATKSQAALNLAQNSNAIGIIITAITSLYNVVKTYNELEWSNSEASKFADEIDEIKGRIESTTSDITSALEDTIQDVNNIYADNTLIDEYQEKIEELLNKAKLTPEEQSQLETIVTYFKNNVDGFDDAWSKYVTISEDGKVNLKGDLEEIKDAINSTIDEYQRLVNGSALSELSIENKKSQITSKQSLQSYSDDITAKQKTFNELLEKSGMTESEFLLKYNAAMMNVNPLKKETALAVINFKSNGIIEAYESLEETKSAYNEAVAEMNKLIMTGDDLSDIQKVLNGDYSDAAAVMMAYNAGMISLMDVQNSEWENLTNLEKAAKNTGKNTVIGLVEGTQEYKDALITNSNDLASIVLSEYDRVMEIHSPSVAMFKRGVWTVEGLINGINHKRPSAVNSGATLVEVIKSKMGQVSLFSTGDNLVSGFINGILSGEAFKKIGSAAASVAERAYTSIKDWLGIHSPSKETEKLGKFFSQGFAIGINENSKLAVSAAENLAKTTQNNLSKINISNTLGNIETLRRMENPQAINTSSVKNITNSPVIHLNINGTPISNNADIDLLVDKISIALGDIITNDGMKWG